MKNEITDFTHSFTGAVCTGAILLLAASVEAQSYTNNDGLIYTIANSAINITGYTGSNATVTVPGTINDLPVTTIGVGAFASDETGLTNIMLGTNVASIGQGAFGNCINLISVTIPNSVTNIGENAFQGCHNLSSVTIPNSLSSIAEATFADCFNITSIVIPSSVTSIGVAAFDACEKLTTVTIPNNAISIGEYAFEDCNSLTNVTIPDSVTNIGSGPFSGCSRLAAINVDAGNPAYVAVAGVLFNQNQTTLVQYPAGNAATTYTITNSVTNIGDSAFESCAFTNVTIPNSVSSIGDNAFLTCYNLSSVTIPNSLTNFGSLTNIGNFAFALCTSLTSMTIPNSVINIGEAAFEDCDSLTSVTIPNSVTTIGGTSFNECISLTNVVIGAGVTSIEEDAFYYCPSLASVTIGSGVTNIESYAFGDCTNLTAVYFQGNVPSPTNDTTVFSQDTSNPIAYYFDWATGWGLTFDGIPTVELKQPMINICNFGIRTNQFQFVIMGTTNFPVVIEACTNLTNPVWIPLQTNSLTNSSIYFSDPQWTNYPIRFYRVRSQ